MNDCAIGQPERRAVPWADDAALPLVDTERSVGQRTGQVRAVIGEDVDVLAATDNKKIDAADRQLRRSPIRQVVQVAE